METAKMILEYLKIALSFPAVIGVLTIYFISLFRQDLSRFISRIVEAHGFGASVKATSPSEQREEIRDLPPQKPLDMIEEIIKNDPHEFAQEFLKVFNSYWFERAYNLIYGTQISLLEHLATKGIEGEYYINLYPFYQEFVRRSSLASTQIADYLGFLKEANFLEYFGEDVSLRAKISAYGLDFLTYIKGQYPTSYGLRPF